MLCSQAGPMPAQLCIRWFGDIGLLCQTSQSIPNQYPLCFCSLVAKPVCCFLIRVCWWLTVMTSAKTSKRPLQILPKRYPCCLPALGNTGLVCCNCQSPSAFTVVRVSYRCFSPVIRPPFLRSHTNVICEDQYSVLKELSALLRKVISPFYRWDLLAELSTRTQCFTVVVVPSATSKQRDM